VLGSLLIGALLQSVVLRRPDNAHWRALATTGFCGGFTTWSTFMVGADELIAAHRPAPAIGYLALSVVAGLAAVVAGAGVTARIMGPLPPAGEA
jgi:CrcB protein